MKEDLIKLFEALQDTKSLGCIILSSVACDIIKNQFVNYKMIYDNLDQISKLIKDLNDKNYINKSATIRNLCKRMIDYISEFGLE